MDEVGIPGTIPPEGEAAIDRPVGLPGWIYRDPEYFAVESDLVLRPSWQVVCHLADVPAAGDFQTLDFLGHPLVVLRGDDGVVRAFHNVCRHRAARLLDGDHGRCGRTVICPYHAWSWDLAGRLVGVPFRSSHAIDPAALGLKPVETEIWHGFVFVRLEGGGPSVAAMMAPYEDVIAPYRFEDLVPDGRVTLRPRAVNWKTIADNYADSLHIPIAHPGLTRLFGKGYRIEATEWVDRMWGWLRDEPSSALSERLYQRLLPEVPHLPASHQRLWTYFRLWPNVAFDVYPDQFDFMQFVPVSATETLIREIAYVFPDDRRAMRAARRLNWRINRQVNAEDTDLVGRVQAGMGSTSYEVGPLGTEEVCLRHFATKMRRLVPEARLDRAPPRGWSLGRTR